MPPSITLMADWECGGVIHNDLHFTPVSLGIADLEGHVQIREGLKVGDQVVAYSENPLKKQSRIHVVDHISGTRQ